MNGFLLDTDVVSTLSPSRTEASGMFLDWLERMDREGRVFLSVVTIHEIEKGIALLGHRGATAKAARLKAWLAGLVSAYDDKIVGLDASAAALSGQAEAKAIAAGHDPGMADAVLAGIRSPDRDPQQEALHAVRRCSLVAGRSRRTGNVTRGFHGDRKHRRGIGAQRPKASPPAP